jgi:hypothetical protein
MIMDHSPVKADRIRIFGQIIPEHVGDARVKREVCDTVFPGGIVEEAHRHIGAVVIKPVHPIPPREIIPNGMGAIARAAPA